MEKLKLIFPCSFKWEQEQDALHHQYCHDCKKLIRDFSSLSVDEISSTIKTSDEPICGRFHESQITTNVSNYSIVHLKPITFSILTLLGLTEGQELIGQTNDSIQITDSTKFSKLKFPLKLNGQLKDKTTKEEIPFASVVLLQGDKQLGVSTTDMDGKFSFVLEDNNVSDSLFSLRVYNPGYSSLVNYRFELTDSLVNNAVFNLSLQLTPNSPDTKEDLYYVGFIEPNYEAPSDDQPKKGKTKKRKKK